MTQYSLEPRVSRDLEQYTCLLPSCRVMPMGPSICMHVFILYITIFNCGPFVGTVSIGHHVTDKDSSRYSCLHVWARQQLLKTS